MEDEKKARQLGVGLDLAILSALVLLKRAGDGALTDAVFSSVKARSLKGGVPEQEIDEYMDPIRESLR